MMLSTQGAIGFSVITWLLPVISLNTSFNEASVRYLESTGCS
ncbi:MAG TPA: hypothetical protein V6C98_02425 [Thermosynechococcaceae cyanobacterium]